MTDTIPRDGAPTDFPDFMNDDATDPGHAGTTAPRSGIEQAINAVAPARTVPLATALLRYGVKDGDPIIEIIRIAIDADVARQAASAAAQAAGAAAQTVGTETAKIPDQIYQGAVHAGDEIRAAIKREIEDSVVNTGRDLVKAIRQINAEQTNLLKQAAADLPKAARERQAHIVNEWQRALGKAATAGVSAKMMRSWGVVMSSLLLAAIVGASGALIGARFADHLTPWRYPIASTPAGSPECGTLRGADGREYAVCVAR